MRIHPAGYLIIAAIALAVLLILFAFNLIFREQGIAHYILYGIGFVFLILVFRFFRRPRRNPEKNNELIYSSADGNVVAIEEVFEKEYFKEKRQLVSVFMTLFDVHVNWFPVSGKIKYNRHTKGRFYAAYVPKSSEENERNSIVIENENGEILVRQIAGVLARRILCKYKKGDMAIQGKETGMIKFGSRVDIFLPMDAEIQVEIGQHACGAKTVIAKFK